MWTKTKGTAKGKTHKRDCNLQKKHTTGSVNTHMRLQMYCWGGSPLSQQMLSPKWHPLFFFSCFPSHLFSSPCFSSSLSFVAQIQGHTAGPTHTLLRARGIIGSRSVYGKAPMKQLHINSNPIAWPHRKANQLIRRYHPYARTSASQAVLSRMQLTVHATRRTPHGDLRLVLAMSAWSVKIRRAPSRHCKGCEGLWSYDYAHYW